MSSDFPIEEDILNSGSLSNVVFDHVTPARAFAVNNNSNVRYIAAKVVSYKISRTVVFRSGAGRKGFTLASEKYHQIRNAAVIDVAVRLSGNPFPFPRVRREILNHIFVHFFLQIDTQSPIRTDYLVGTDACAGWNVTPRIRDANIRRVIANCMICPFGRRAHQAPKKALLGCRHHDSALCPRDGTRYHDEKRKEPWPHHHPFRDIDILDHDSLSPGPKTKLTFRTVGNVSERGVE